MAEEGEASTAAESFRAGNGEGEGGRVGNASSDFPGKKADVDQRAGDPSSSNPEPSVSDRNDRGKTAAPGVSPAPDGMFRGFLPMPGMENWPFNPSMMESGFDFGAVGAPPLVPVLLPGPFPTYYPIPGQDQQLPTGGIFAVPVMPMFGSMGAIPQGGFMPLSFNMPPVAPPVPPDGQQHVPPVVRPVQPGRGALQAAVRDAAVRDAAAPDGIRQRHGAAIIRGPQGGPRPGDPQRQQQVVRRFQVGFQLDLLLIIKLAVVVIVFNQDGTKDRLMLLLLVAGIVYMYQTGALAPIIRWISLSAQRAMMPPQQPLPGADGAPNPVGVGVAPPNLRDAPIRPEVREETPAAAPVVDIPGGQGEVPPDPVGGDEQRAEQPPQNPNWWGLLKELQMIVVGFLTSLLPGFQHVE